MRRRFLRFILCLVMIVMMTVPFLSFADTEGAPSPIVSNPVDSFTQLGFTTGTATTHGNNQTRLATTSTGIYLSYPLEETKAFDFGSNTELDGARYALIRINFDNTVELLLEDYVFFVAAGGTTNVMVDKNEDIWVCTSWDEGSGFYPLVAWHYDTKANKATRYTEVGYYSRGNGFGKANSIIDPVNNCIYQVVLGGQKCPGNMIWTTFDIETKTWTKMMKYAKPPVSCCYHFGYATGKGGFVITTERTLDNLSTPSNIEGMLVSEAMRTFLSRCEIENEQVWDESHILYVPDASKAEVFDQPLIEAHYDVERGVYPTIVNYHNDVYYDAESGYLYSFLDTIDVDSIGTSLWLVVVDTHHFEGTPEGNEFFPVVCRKKLSFVYGDGIHYTAKMVKDSLGNAYLVVAPERVGEIQIWRATDEIFTEYELVYTTSVEDGYNSPTYNRWNAIISATERNNSTMSDKIYFAFSGNVVWVTFYVDFAALRDYIDQRGALNS